MFYYPSDISVLVDSSRCFTKRNIGTEKRMWLNCTEYGVWLKSAFLNRVWACSQYTLHNYSIILVTTKYSSTTVPQARQQTGIIFLSLTADTWTIFLSLTTTRALVQLGYSSPTGYLFVFTPTNHLHPDILLPSDQQCKGHYSAYSWPMHSVSCCGC